ncbi:hypothetical protein DBR00_13735 [Pseudomonas sp. HMWF032]|uniref:methionyl-tRNA formyltransferase n=1 Tax=Pseudomonas sp. HMWF032 TaxID=2056866 RepID=UPI000D39ACB8|nr:formyltransferase family protein [Pseudomonas sp. HMWF032]PTS83564.1 hypothetical protein DBR00_13735 [Pseudomonas sp. HMWF032]PTT84076.1 hypothetical protein DBR41_08965 [Pseudomonas sp. HMWF010]
MKLVLLGAGEEAKIAAKSLLAAGHTLIGVGPAPLHGELNIEGARLIASHAEIDYKNVDNVLMISYPDLIASEHLLSANYFNIHFALLPRYRGYHPVQWAIINGEKEIGYSLHKVDEGVDSGPIYYQGSVEISSTDNYALSRAKVVDLLSRTLGQAFRAIEAGQEPSPQDERNASYFCKRSAVDGRLDWARPVNEIYNLCRAIAPPAMPGAYFVYKGQQVHIDTCDIAPIEPYIGPTGKVVSVRKDAIFVKAGDGVLVIKTVRVDGVVIPAPQLIKRIGLSLSD